MANTERYVFDLEEETDQDALRELLDVLSDAAEWEDDDEDEPELQSPSRPVIRVGADCVPANSEQHEIDEITHDEIENYGEPSPPFAMPEAVPSTSSRVPTIVSTSGPQRPSCSTRRASRDEEPPTQEINQVDSLLEAYFDDVEKLKKTSRKGKNKELTVDWGENDLNSPISVPNNTPKLDDLISEEILTPLEYFNLYLPEDIFESAAFHTNLFAEQQQSTRFKQTHEVELQQLVGLHIMCGNLKFPRIHLYWDRRLRLNVFPETMSRERFFQLRTHLHFVDNLKIGDKDKRDRFYKVRPLYDSIRNRCLKVPLENQLSIDEQIIPFRGQLNVKQYVKGKPCPWGIKMFYLCGKSGFPYDFVIYQGETTELDPTAKHYLGASSSVVYTLARRRITDGSRHELYYDNYFSGFHLLKLLKLLNIDAAGTIRLNRFFSPPLTEDKVFQKKKRGTSEAVSDQEVVVVKWLDNKSVVLASNFIGIGQEDTAKRWDKKEKKYMEIKRPEIIKKYNHAMGGVDLLDQMLSLYRIYIRSRKWTLRMIFHGIEVAIFCGWKEYKRTAEAHGIPLNQQLDLLGFRMRLADQLVVPKPAKKEEKKRGRPAGSSKKRARSESGTSTDPPAKKALFEVRPYKEVVFDGLSHLPYHDDKELRTRCKNEGCKQKTHTFCMKCRVHLCIAKERNCFGAFHTKPKKSGKN